jgi:hypothetical protein
MAEQSQVQRNAGRDKRRLFASMFDVAKNRDGSSPISRDDLG